MDTGLKGTSALITGGDSGIGLGIATVPAQEGVNLAIASLDPIQEAIRDLREEGVRVIDIKADVSKEDQVKEGGHIAIKHNIKLKPGEAATITSVTRTRCITIPSGNTQEMVYRVTPPSMRRTWRESKTRVSGQTSLGYW